MRAFFSYLVVSALVVVSIAALLASWIVPSAAGTIWSAAGLAYLVQAVAFAALTHARGSRLGWVVAWGSGTLLRLLVVLGAALWVARSDGIPAAPLLLSLAGFHFLLLVLEPVFFRTGMRSR
jgi:hypothetical protein